MARTARRLSAQTNLPVSTSTHQPQIPARARLPNAHDFLEYYFLYRIAATLTDKMVAERPMREVQQILGDFFHLQEYALLLWDEAAQTFRRKSHAGPARPRITARLCAEDKILRAALRHKSPTHFPDLSRASAAALARCAGPKTGGDLLLIPMHVRPQHCLGALLLYRKKPNSFSQQEITLLQKIATQLGKVLDKIALQQQTRALSITDALTGLYNRRHFNERYGAEFMRAARYLRPLSVLLIDIDHFKKFNDEHGHLVGDKVLKLTAKVLDDSIRKADILARFGGEEFVVVLPEIDKEHALQVAEKLRRAIELTHFPKEESQPFGHITASFGLAAFPEDASEGNALLKLADQALYEAKANGRNRVEAVKKSPAESYRAAE